MKVNEDICRTLRGFADEYSLSINGDERNDADKKMEMYLKEIEPFPTRRIFYRHIYESMRNRPM